MYPSVPAMFGEKIDVLVMNVLDPSYCPVAIAEPISINALISVVA